VSLERKKKSVSIPSVFQRSIAVSIRFTLSVRSWTD